MKTKFNLRKWLSSRNGMLSALGALLVLLLIVAYFSGSLGGLFGTAGLPDAAPTYEDPPNGYTCLPSCGDDNPRMFVLPGNNTASFGGQELWVWIATRGDNPSFTLDIFDGDVGKDDTGAYNFREGNWDYFKMNVDYTLYADPVQTGSTSKQVAKWNADSMPNNQWFSATVNNVPEARSPGGYYFYLLKVTRNDETTGINAFKVRSSGFLSVGASNFANKPFGIEAAYGGSLKDILVYFPQRVSASNLGTSPYQGDWNFKFLIPNNTTKLEIWDGDFDRGGNALDTSADTKDPNSPPKPDWAVASTVNERAGGKGNPADNSSFELFRRSVPVVYQFTDPKGNPIYVNDNPSGTEEWERFVVSTTPDDPNADLITDSIAPGFYNLDIQGLDVANSVWLKVDFQVCDSDAGCQTVWTENACPRTIGYWKNNIKKIYVQNKTNGIQESKESLDRALVLVAEMSPLYRHGLNASNPQAISAIAPLTAAEASDIMQKKTPEKNSMLGRALQQNLATWLNLASGKINGSAVVHIAGATGGDFDGTLFQALQYNQDIMLDPAKRADPNLIGRAKDIADIINNNQMSTDASEENGDSLACSAYETGSVPKDKQPPHIKDLPKAPKPTPEPVTPPEPFTPPPAPACRAPEYKYGQGYAIIALNPAACQGEQNGLLFHGTSTTTVSSAYSNGCLRSVGTHSVKGLVDYFGESFGDMTLIDPAPTQVTEQLPESAWKIDAPNCADPAAMQMDGKDFKGDMFLTPGLYCISGDATVNASDTLQGSGVTLYFTDGKLTINGGAMVNLSAPEGDSVSPALPGVLIYLPDSNSNPVQIDGNSESWYSGTIYAPKSEINVLGTGQVHGGWAQFIGWDVEVGGTADVWIDYLDRNLPACTPQ